MMWGFGEGLWVYLLPIYIGSLGADSVQIGFVLSIAMVLMTVSFIPAGWLSDRVSRKNVMLVGWLLGFFAVLILALARTWQQALPGLVLYNLSGFCMPIINAYVTSEVRPGENLRRTFTVVFTGYTIGSVFSPATGGWMADTVGLRQVFVLSALFFAISAGIVLFIRNQPVHRAAEGTLSPSLRHDRVFISLCLLFFAIILAAYVGVPLAPNFLQNERGLAMGSIGILGSVNALGGVVLTYSLGRWPKGRASGLLIAQAAVGAYALLLLTTTSTALLGLAVFLRSGVGVIRQLAAARMGEILPAGSMGLGYGIFATVVNLAFTVSPYMAGWLYAFHPTYPFVANLLLTVPAMLLTYAIGRQGPTHEQPSGVSAERA
jgi:DHA1 family tetracycline resistance protein-like MFS transporter